MHSNVGGGLRSDGLANCALRWIVEEAVDAGLDVRQDFLDHYREFPADQASTKSAGFRFADTVLRPIRGFNGVRSLAPPEGITLDQTVFDRLNADPKEHKKMKDLYRPKNLLNFLTAHSEYDSKLGPDALRAVQNLRQA